MKPKPLYARHPVIGMGALVAALASGGCERAPKPKVDEAAAVQHLALTVDEGVARPSDPTPRVNADSLKRWQGRSGV